MTHWNSIRSAAIVTVLLLSSIPAANFAAQFLGKGGAALLDIHPVSAQAATIVGIDCGLGAVEVGPDITGDGVPDADGSLDLVCTWIGDVDGDLVFDPLVSDDPVNFPSATGGGLTIEVRATGLPTSTNGFDMTVNYDPTLLNGVKFDQTGLPFNGAFTPTPATIDNSIGQAKLAQVLLGGTVSGDVTFFRIRFDVVGAGTGPISITNSVITNPGSVPHKINPNSFNSQNAFDPSSLGLSWNLAWTFSPNPAVPGSQLTLTATASCPGCTGTLTYSWDTNSDGSEDASGSTATITPPPPIVHRVTLTATDGASNSATAVRRIPLNVAVNGPASIAVGATADWTGSWIGGIPPYVTGSAWRFCPGSATAITVCAKPAPTIPGLPTQLQSNVVTVQRYNFAGIYTGTLKIIDTTSQQIALTPTTVTATFTVDVTGTPKAYTVTVAANPPNADPGSSIAITATMQYDTAYPTTFRSSFFDVTFQFGDGLSQKVSGGTTGCATTSPFTCTVSTTHTYTTKGSYTITARAQETAAAAVTKIQEVGTSSVTINAPPLNVAVVADNTSPQVDEPVTFTATASGGTSPYTFAWNFGDGTTGVGNPVAHAFTTGGAKTITVTVTDANSATATNSVTINVQGGAALSADFTFSPSSPVAGQTVSFTGTATGGTPPYSFSWNFGDGQTGTGETVTHTYAAKGSFTVALTVTDSAAGTTTASHSVDVSPVALSADFIFSPASPTAGKAVTFTATASGGTGPYTFSWAFGDTTTGTGSPVSHTYAAKGSFSVVLTVTDANSETVSVTKTVVVAGQPLTGDFTFSPASPTSGKTVTFTATSSGGTGPHTFSWNFGDGTPAGSGSPLSHTYTTKGSKTVVLTITDANTATTQVTKTVVVVGQPIVADFSFSPTTPGVNEPVTFTATSSGGTAPYSFSWAFGDGTTGTGSPVTHSYATSGDKTVVLTVTDANDASVQVTKTVTVTVVVPPLCDQSVGGCDFTVSPASPTVGEAATFTVAINGGTSPYQCSFNFGDGPSGSPVACSNGSTFTHTYAAKGPFTVVLTITDSASGTSTVSHSLVVQPVALAADFTFTPATPQPGESVTFTATVSGGTSPYTFSWNFGDGTPAGIGNPVSHTFASKGPKTVTLTVTDANAASADVSKVVNVSSIPLAGDFTFNPPTPSVGDSVAFTASASGGTAPYSFSWDFGDGTPAGSGSPVSHIYATKGSKTVVLTITDANAASTDVTKTVVVAGQPIVADFTVSPASPTVGKPVTFTATVTGGTTPYTFSWNFGDTTTGSGNPVSHTYAAQGSYDVVLTLTDANDVSQTASHTISVAPQGFSVDFTFNPATPTANKPVMFTAIVTGGTPPFTYTWDFGDGTTGTGVSPTHSYTVKGSYQVVLSVSDSLGETGGASHSVIVASQPLGVDFSATGDMTVGGVITFTVTSNSGGTSPYSFEWDFGDGSIASGIEANHTYAVKGSYTVKVTMTDANGEPASASKPVTIAPQPLTADFTSSPASPTTGTPVAFNATASGGTSPYTFAWNFGDGTSGSGTSPTHTYTVKGSYTVTVTVTDTNSASTTATHTIIVTPQPLGITGIIVNPARPITGQPATLTAVITGGTGPYTVTWDFGDNTSGTGNPVTHTYAALGNYTVTATVTDANQAQATLTATVTVVEQGLPLAADFAPTRTLVGTTNFVAKITGGTPPYTCSWNFGDGTPVQTGCNTDHTYTLAGSFSATLTVVDSSSQTASASNTVVVEPAPRLFRGKVHWTHHLAGGINATQTFMAKISNPSSFTVEVTLTVDIFTDTGVFVARVTGTTTLAPFSVNLGLTVPWTPTMTGKFTLTATLSYKVNFGDLSMPTDGIPEMVTGTNGSKSGAFAVVP